MKRHDVLSVLDYEKCTSGYFYFYCNTGFCCKIGNKWYCTGIPLSRSDCDSFRVYVSIGNQVFVLFNATFNNISVILWRSLLLVKETGVPSENDRPAASHCQTLSHNVVCLALSGIRTHNISGDIH